MKKVVEMYNIQRFTDENKLDQVSELKLRGDLLQAKLILGRYINKLTLYSVHQDNLQNANSIFQGLSTIIKFLIENNLKKSTENIKVAYEMFLKLLITLHPHTKDRFWACIQEILKLPSFSGYIHKSFADAIAHRIDAVLGIESAIKIIKDFQELEQSSTASFFEFKQGPSDLKRFHLLFSEIKNLEVSFQKEGVISADEIRESLKKACPDSLAATPYFRKFKQVLKSFEVFLSKQDIEDILPKGVHKGLQLNSFK
ncbi:MAG: hypothetical protein JSR33_02145 [Proteobacteria bacterium]|nr:hypothetical protein [Pseudomonadota bacterium]